MSFEPASIPDRLKEAVRTQMLVPFVGAGLSKQAATSDKKAFPSWTELLQELQCHALRHKYINSSEAKQIQSLVARGRYLMAAEAIRSEVPANDIESIITERFFPPDAKPGLVHKWLFKLQPDVILTTNYDKLIEDAFAAEFKKAAHAWTFKNAPEVQRALQSFRHGIDRPIVFKIHGCVGTPSDAILSEIDYRQLLYREPGYKMVLSAVFVTKVVLMLGFSFADPELAVLTETLRDALKYRSGPDYIFLPAGEKGSVEKRRLKDDFGLEVIEYDASPDHREVVDLLKFLAGFAKSAAATKKSTPSTAAKPGTPKKYAKKP